MAENFALGIECVGMSNSVAVVANSAGQIVSAARLPLGISLHATSHVDISIRLNRLFRMVLRPIDDQISSDYSNLSVCVGMTGATFPYDGDVELPAIVRRIANFPNLICTGDLELVAAANQLWDGGSCIVCHNGSACLVVDGFEGFRSGGWGPALGDEGSAYWIGRQALRAIGSHRDRRSTDLYAQLLWEAINDWLIKPDHKNEDWEDASLEWRRVQRSYKRFRSDCDMRPAIFLFAHQIAKKYSFEKLRNIISGLAIAVFSAADAELSSGRSLAAGDLLSKAASELAVLFQTAGEAAGGYNSKHPLVLYGGVFKNHPRFCELLKVRLHRVTDSIDQSNLLKISCSQCSQVSFRPAIGALLIALCKSADWRNLALGAPAFVPTLESRVQLFPELIND